MLKQMALRVAALADSDRQWLLAHLSDAERQKLEPLVEEAMSLGLHLDPSVLSALAQTDEASPAPVKQTAPASSVLIDQLRTAHPFWRDLLEGSTGSVGIVNGSEFQQLLNNTATGPVALRQCVVDYLIATRETEHV